MTIIDFGKEKDIRNTKRLLFICWLFSLTAIFFSLGYEYFWHVEPCRLCKLQRIPYFLVVAIAPFGLSLQFNKWAKLIVQFCFSAILALSTWHLLIQTGVIDDTCVVPKNVNSIEDFKQMLNAPISCAKTTWRFFGLPVSFYNAYLACLFSVLLAKNNDRALHRTLSTTVEN